MKLETLFFLFINIEIVLLLKNPKTHRNWHLVNEAVCGESITDRIIGGTKAEMGQFPWMARLGYIIPAKGIYKVTKSSDFKCGGAVINHLYVLTAGHCMPSEKNSPILALVRLGEFDPRTNIDCVDGTCMPPPQDFQPVKKFVHENYSAITMHNDVGLIRLDRPAEYNAYVIPICLPYDMLMNKRNLPERLSVAGWGFVDSAVNKMSDYLYYVYIPLRPMSVCERLLPRKMLAKGQLCVGGTRGKDSCGGDSGGPLMAPAAIDGPPRYFQLGIVSFGVAECGANVPAIYTEVAYFLDWILDKLEP